MRPSRRTWIVCAVLALSSTLLRGVWARSVWAVVVYQRAGGCMTGERVVVDGLALLCMAVGLIWLPIGIATVVWGVRSGIRIRVFEGLAWLLGAGLVLLPLDALLTGVLHWALG